MESHGRPQNSGDISADFHGSSMEVCGVPWSPTGLYDRVWKTAELHGVLRISAEFHCFLWKNKIFHGKP